MISTQTVSRLRLLAWGLRGAAKMVVVSLGLLATRAHSTETVTYYYTNPQATVLATADPSGNVTSATDYRPYGEQTLGLSSPGFGYSGHVNDPDTGLVYMQARYVDPTIGRFYGVDPRAPDPGKLENFNRYAYARNNPVRYVDLDGKQSWCTPGNCGADSYLKASNDIAYFRENFDVVAEVKGAGGPGLELNYNLSQGRGATFPHI